MKKIIFTFLSFFILLSTVNAQKSINFFRQYGAGGKQVMYVDSSAKNVFYWNIFPNQPHTSFNYLPDVNNVTIQLYFRKEESIPKFRYTILVDGKPTIVNKSIKKAELTDIQREEGIYSFTTLGVFRIKGKIITTLVYNIEKPQNIDKTVYYGKPIPKAKIKALGKHFAIDGGVSYKYITDPKEKTTLFFSDKDDELTIVKDKSDIDYIYYVSIKDKQTNKLIYESTEFLPYVKIDNSIFKKSGDYEIAIQPSIKWTGCLDCDISPKRIKNYASRYTLSITLEEENYTKKELLIYTLIVAFAIGLTFLVILYYIKKRNKKKLEEKEQQRNIAKLQLNSVRSQLNPHFLFNALSGIQNLMNKNEVDNANKYLSKFARLTRNVLDDKELISLSQEKTLLDDYLQMEQLRFGFKYEINSSENLDLDNIEIPGMLLQPFVENAVKHGISQRASDGKITITFTKQANDLVLSVTDNGNGFDTKKKSTGLGLPLSSNRIELLNSIYKENRFILNMESTSTGTKISLALTEWL
jgi:two-component system LytT family sensor kinase